MVSISKTSILVGIRSVFAVLFGCRGGGGDMAASVLDALRDR
jgi:hypothetical protein